MRKKYFLKIRKIQILMLKIIKLIFKFLRFKKKIFSCFLIAPFSQTIAPSWFGNLKYSTVLTLYLIFTLVWTCIASSMFSQLYLILQFAISCKYLLLLSFSRDCILIHPKSKISSICAYIIIVSKNMKRHKILPKKLFLSNFQHNKRQQKRILRGLENVIRHSKAF